MKKIINKKIYDTDTAECIASDEFSNSFDFNYCFEAVYKTKKGTFFFYGTGGPASKYAEYYGNGSTGGSSVIYELSPEKAKELIMLWASPDEVIKLFPKEIEEA
jgi:hypothetical protein